MENLILVTGAAGFIGFHLSRHLLEAGYKVVGLDNLNAYYDPILKTARLTQLQKYPQFYFFKRDLSDKDAILDFAQTHPKIQTIIHLAAQAGVRYSIENPHAYAESNLVGYLNVLELARRLKGSLDSAFNHSFFNHLIYASSSSVYGSNDKLPFSIFDPVDKPISFYAATKRANELMSHTYSHLYQLPITGLRFFTVYGPWGRPDMSAFIFTKAILNEQPLPVFNHGDMRRNFTYIDDVIQGVMGCLNNPPKTPIHRLYNIGNNKSVPLMDFIHSLEKQLGKKAILDFQPMQAGDVKETIADITDTQRDFGFQPKTHIEQGLGHFTRWYQEFYKTCTKKQQTESPSLD